MKPRSRILGTGSFLPAKVRTNADLERMVDTSDDWIRERTGIAERRIADDGMLTSDMAANAGRAALEASGLSGRELDMIVVGTVTPDVPMPATAVYVQQKLDAGTCPAFDLSAACAGFVFGLAVADSFICSGLARHVLVIGVELLSSIVDWSDRTTCVLFGDGAGAVVVGPAADDGHGILSTQIRTDGSLAGSLIIPAGGVALPISSAVLDAKKHKVRMKGQDIFKVAVKNLYSASKAALEAGGVGVEGLDWLCAHQANRRILDQLVARLQIAPSKVLTNIERVGNTSSASIPILFDESVRKGDVKRGDSVLMCALGAGVSWGSALLRY